MPSHQRYCCVCKNHGQKIVDGRKVSMHRFPANKQARKLWIQRCKNARPNFLFINCDQTRLCSDHFIGKMGPTKDHKLPSIFPQQKGGEKVYKISQLDDTTNDSSSDHDISDVNETVTAGASHESSFSDDADGLSTNDTSMLDVSLQFHDYSGNVPQNSDVRHQCEQIQPEMVTTGTQTDSTEWKSTETSESFTQTINTQTCDVNLQINGPSLTFDDISDSESKIMFYTGIPNSATVVALFDELKSGMEKENENGRPRSLRLIDEFFMVLMRLRLGLLLEDLADRFRISTSTCSLIFNRWIDYLDVQLSFLVMWPSRTVINNTMPEKFRRKYPKCRVVIDCTEIRTETPSSLKLRSLLYSDYKSHMTYKSLIGISPNGVVTFVSDLYTGSTSDKQITKLSGLIDLCEANDAIMADKGFLISDMTTAKAVDLIIPPFKRSKKQFLPHEVIATRDIANLRIHVERQMERVKNFHIVQGVMPITMASQSSKIWKLCVRLTNLQPQLVLRN